MKRSSAGWIVGILLFGLLAVFAPSAAAAPSQADPDACFPGSDPDYPPTGNPVEIEPALRLASGQFNPGASGQLVIEGAVPNVTYCGILFSTPVSLPEKADGQGRLTYNIAVPADFELNAMHHIDMYRAQRQVGSFDFCVSSSGAVAPASSCVRGGTDGSTDGTTLGTDGGTTGGTTTGGTTGGKNAGPLPSGRSPLAKTGTNSLLEILRVAIVLLGLGAGAYYLKRRRDQGQATA